LQKIIYMKKTYLSLLSALLLSVSVNAQQAKIKIPFLNAGKQNLKAEQNSKDLPSSQKFTAPVVNSQVVCLYDSTISTEWDSTINNWSLNYAQKSKFTYNSSSLVTQELGEYWNGINWTQSSKIFNTYDAQGNQTISLQQYWGGTSWNNSALTTRTFNSQNSITSNLYQNWNGTSWDNSSRYITNYNAQNYAVNSTSELWTNNAWLLNYKESMSYDLNNNQLSYAYYYYSSGILNSADSSKYTYNASNDMTNSVYYIWSASNGWVKSDSSFATYGPNHQYTAYYTYSWNGSSWDKQNFYTSITYDANNNMTSYIEMQWNGSAYVNSIRVTMTYDANNNMTMELAEQWNLNTNTFVNQSKYISHYNNFNINLSDSSLEWTGNSWALSYLDNYVVCSNGYCYSNKLTLNNFSSGGYYKSKTDYFGCLSNVGIDENGQTTSVLIYPNPCNGVFNLSVSNHDKFKIEVLNYLGENLYSSFYNSNNAYIDISNQPKGVYFVKITPSNSGTIVKKIILE
jgi:hypothetical protein